MRDRGQMLESVWQRLTRNDSNLASWREGVKEGWRPAAIFNATIAETGEPLLFSTTESRRQRGAPDRRICCPPDRDVRIVTAVRLAASFPYVAPAARPQGRDAEYHVIDGGYYDNYGVASAVQWIDEAFTAMEPSDLGGQIPNVLMIQIRSFPRDAQIEPKFRGWFFQTHAPITGLLSERVTAQMVRDRNDLLMLQRRWWGPNREPRIRFATFEFPGGDAPLSWKMNASQTQAIQRHWTQIAHAGDPNFDQVQCMFVPSGERCKDLAMNRKDLAVNQDPW
jgi:hypothetical protein